MRVKLCLSQAYIALLIMICIFHPSEDRRLLCENTVYDILLFNNGINVLTQNNLYTDVTYDKF